MENRRVSIWVFKKYSWKYRMVTWKPLSKIYGDRKTPISFELYFSHIEGAKKRWMAPNNRIWYSSGLRLECSFYCTIIFFVRSLYSYTIVFILIFAFINALFYWDNDGKKYRMVAENPSINNWMRKMVRYCNCFMTFSSLKRKSAFLQYFPSFPSFSHFAMNFVILAIFRFWFPIFGWFHNILPYSKTFQRSYHRIILAKQPNSPRLACIFGTLPRIVCN